MVKNLVEPSTSRWDGVVDEESRLACLGKPRWPIRPYCPRRRPASGERREVNKSSAPTGSQRARRRRVRGGGARRRRRRRHAAGRVRRAPVALLLGEGAPDGGLRVACRCSEWLVVLVALTASFFGAAAGRVAIVDWVRGACHFGLHRQAAPPASIVGSA